MSRLEALYEEHSRPALRLAYLLTGDVHRAEDIVQDAFVRVAGRFRHLGSIDDFQRYLNQMVVNLSRDQFRRLRVERRYLDKERAEVKPPSSHPHAIDEQTVVMQALAMLAVRQRAAIVLRFYEDLSEQQIADALDCSIGAETSDHTDTDSDGQGDPCDTDDDNDGVADTGDNCPLSFGGSSVQTNSDADPQGDVCDTDDDNDGVNDAGADGLSGNADADNCRTIANGAAQTGFDGNQRNTDGAGDGGDACDTDDDNDGLTDTQETTGSENPYPKAGSPTDRSTDPKDADSDNDGLSDGQEATAGSDGVITNPNDVDTDDDGTGDAQSRCTRWRSGGATTWRDSVGTEIGDLTAGWAPNWMQLLVSSVREAAQS